MSADMQERTTTGVSAETVIDNIPEDILPDGLTISGGEPFDQSKAVRIIMEWFIPLFGDDVLIYTGYTLSELIERHDNDTDWVICHVAAIVDGPYIWELNTGKGLKGSSNQTLHVFRHHERYYKFNECNRSLQGVNESERLFLIGIPPQHSNQ